MRTLRPSAPSALATFVVASLASLAACSSTAPAQKADASISELPRIPVTLSASDGPFVVRAEVADAPDTRTRGLMFRTSMKEDEGMLFLFPAEEQLTFWMRNTLIPLDMIFIRPDHTILGVVESATPKTDTGRAIPGLSQFVLEVNGGFAARHGIRAGDTVDFYAPTPSR